MEANDFMTVPPIYPATSLQGEYSLMANFFLFDHAPTYRASAKSFSIDETRSFLSCACRDGFTTGTSRIDYSHTSAINRINIITRHLFSDAMRVKSPA
jgi:hypothetical protein